MSIHFEIVSTSDPYWQQVRDRHYVANKGTVGRVIACRIFVDEIPAGIISAGASTWCGKERDAFFGIDSSNNKIKGKQLGCIANNTVFRLERNEHLSDRNLGTKILGKFRPFAEDLWKAKYGDTVVGWQTFVGQSDRRAGAVYRADNWTLLGLTQGFKRNMQGLDPGTVSFEQTDRKLIFCRWSLDRGNSSRRRRVYFSELPPVTWVDQGSLF